MNSYAIVVERKKDRLRLLPIAQLPGASCGCLGQCNGGASGFGAQGEARDALPGNDACGACARSPTLGVMEVRLRDTQGFDQGDKVRLETSGPALLALCALCCLPIALGLACFGLVHLGLGALAPLSARGLGLLFGLGLALLLYAIEARYILCKLELTKVRPV